MKAALKTDWKTEALPSKRTTIRLNRRFPPHEIQHMRMGLVPEQMEDKWFIYWEKDTLFFHRSWTGYCIYVVRFIAEGEYYLMTEANVSRAPEQYSESSDERDAKMISFLIDELLLQQEATFPSDEASFEKHALIKWSQVGRAMLGEHPKASTALPRSSYREGDESIRQESYLDFCEQLWVEWLAGKVYLSLQAAPRFSLDHIPEPYLLFGEGKKPLYVLLTNPGRGLRVQHRNTIASRNSCVQPEMSYRNAAVALAAHYERNLKFGAKRRLGAMLELKSLMGADSVTQLEVLPFHSKSLPGKPAIRHLVEETPLLSNYVNRLCKAIAQIKNGSVIGLSGVDSSRSISPRSIERNSWLKWKAEILGIDPVRIQMLKLAQKNGKVTRAFLYQRFGEDARGLILTMGSNSMPDSKGLQKLARLLQERSP